MLHVHTNEYIYVGIHTNIHAGIHVETMNQALFWTDIRVPDSKLRSQRLRFSIQNFAELPDVFVCDFGILNFQTSSKVKKFPNLLCTSKK